MATNEWERVTNWNDLGFRIEHRATPDERYWKYKADPMIIAVFYGVFMRNAIKYRLDRYGRGTEIGRITLDELPE